MVSGGVGAQILLIGSGILAARVLGPTDRGRLAFLVLVPLVVGTVGGLGVPQAMTFWLARHRIPVRDLARAVAPALATQIIGVTLVGGVLLVFAARSDGATPAAYLLIVATPAVLMWQYAVAIAQGLRKFRLATGILLLAAGAYSVAVAGIWGTRVGGLSTVAAAWAASYLIAAVIGLTLVLRQPDTVGDTPGTPPISDLLRFGVRTLPSLTSPIQTLRVDQAAIGVLLGPAALGLYVVAVAVTNLPLLLATFMSVSIAGQIASEPDLRLASRALGAMLALLAAASVSVALAVAVLAPALIPAVFGKAFSGAVLPAVILLGGSVAASVQRSMGDGLRAMGDPAASSFGEIACWVVLVPGLILGRAWGINGMALAVTLSYLAALATVAGRWFLRLRRPPDGEDRQPLPGVIDATANELRLTDRGLAHD